MTRSEEPLRVGLVQITTEPGAVTSNLEKLGQSVRDACAQGAEIVVVPELAACGYTLDAEILAASAEPLAGPTQRAWTELSKETGAIVVGGFAEVANGGSLYNSVMAVGPEGCLLHYRKLHLFSSEKKVFTPGDLGLPVVRTRVGGLGVCVCYDLRFVEVLRLLSLQGADLVCVPSAWVQGFDARTPAESQRTHGCPQSDNVVIQANLCQVFVACASHAGQGQEFSFLGSSLLVDPFGRTVVGPASRSAAALEIADVDLSQLERAQQRGDGIQPREDRRTDVYRLQYEGRAL